MPLGFCVDKLFTLKGLRRVCSQRLIYGHILPLGGIRMDREWLRDDQFERVVALLPGKVTDPGRTVANNRLFVESVLWIARTGSRWRDMPAQFGPWNSVYLSGAALFR
jgi:Putative transposase of IS4/5 family (DUF4096)